MDKTHQKVSILIPTYEQSALIERAVNSALAQDYRPLEVIVCDDSRDDMTQTKILPLTATDVRLKYVKNPERLGRTANYRNALYTLASGEWALLLDGDDYLTDEGFISEAVTGIGRSNKIVFAQAGGEIRRMLDGGVSELISTRLPDIQQDIEVVRGVDYVRAFACKRRFLHLTTLFHRKAAMDIDFYRADLLSCDLESFMRLALHGDVLLMKKPVGVWLQHGANAGENASLEDIIGNSRWVEGVRSYAVQKGLLTRPCATRWANAVRNRETIAGFTKELRQLKSEGKSKKVRMNFTLMFLRRYPRFIWHPVFVKKIICG